MDLKEMFAITRQLDSISNSPQETKGEKCYYDCYGTEHAKVCEQSNCLWRDSCIELASTKQGGR
ncbi:MAG: hypothetical protein R8M11_04965 [Gallionella sp.]